MNAEFKILEADSKETLEKFITAYSSCGWSPVGGISIAVDPDSKFSLIYAILMVRYYTDTYLVEYESSAFVPRTA
jgi:hypothetical protein